MQHDRNAPPLNPLPWIVWALALPLIAVELVVQLGERGVVGGPMAIGWRSEAINYFAFVPDILRTGWSYGGWTPDALWRFFRYVLVQGNLMAAVFAVVLLLALGKMVGEIFRWWAVVVVALGAAAAGALAYGFLTPEARVPLIGAYPAVYGLIGAFTFLLWVNLARTGANKYRAFSLIGFLLLFQLIFGVIFGGGWDWIADVTGFAAGVLLSFVVSPGGWSRVMDKMRQR